MYTKVWEKEPNSEKSKYTNYDTCLLSHYSTDILFVHLQKVTRYSSFTSTFIICKGINPSPRGYKRKKIGRIMRTFSSLLRFPKTRKQVDLFVCSLSYMALCVGKMNAKTCKSYATDKRSRFGFYSKHPTRSC